MHSRNQLWIYIGRTDAEAEAPILWPPDAKSQLIGKDPDAGKDWGQVEKEMTQWTWVWANSRRWWRTGKPGVAAVHGVAKSQTRLSDWTTKTRVCVWWTSQLMDRLPIYRTLWNGQGKKRKKQNSTAVQRLVRTEHFHCHGPRFDPRSGN